MAKHIPDKIWDLRKDGDSNGYVMTISDKMLYVYYYADMNNPTKIVDFEINRIDARLLARRILECLEESK
jgi:hypothetical protein